MTTLAQLRRGTEGQRQVSGNVLLQATRQPFMVESVVKVESPLGGTGGMFIEESAPALSVSPREVFPPEWSCNPWCTKHHETEGPRFPAPNIVF